MEKGKRKRERTKVYFLNNVRVHKVMLKMSAEQLFSAKRSEVIAELRETVT